MQHDRVRDDSGLYEGVQPSTSQVNLTQGRFIHFTRTRIAILTMVLTPCVLQRTRASRAYRWGQRTAAGRALQSLAAAGACQFLFTMMRGMINAGQGQPPLLLPVLPV